MKKALIDPIDKISNMDVVVSVADNEFPASEQYFWVSCDDNVAAGWLYDGVNFIAPTEPPSPPTPIPTAEENKNTATLKLKNSDWVEIPSVSDPTSIPHLLNKDEWIAYRNATREFAVNPVGGILQWPVKPSEKWSS